MSSSRKRLAPRLIYKGGILKHWNKKMAVALDNSFFKTLPELPETKEEDADMAWFIYDLVLDKTSNTFKLKKVKTKYTNFLGLDENISFNKYPLDNFFETLVETVEYGQ